MNMNESSMFSVNTAGCYICQNQDIRLELSQLLAPLLPRSCQVVVAKPCEVVLLDAEVVSCCCSFALWLAVPMAGTVLCLPNWLT